MPPQVYEKETADPWNGVMSTTRIRHELGYRPLIPSLWAARDAGVL
ncbi:epimerase [Streptomyces xanthochromogenes]